MEESRELAVGRDRFEAWRRTRPSRRTRIPEALWAEAVRLAGRNGLSRTARTLRLNEQELRRRSAKGATPRPASEAARFVDLAPLALPAVAAPAAYVVELEVSGGARLRIEVHGEGRLDVESLARSFVQGWPCSR
jgi:hypothetical protein